MLDRKFDRGDGRYKHRWTKDEAGFEPGAKGAVGKCHSSISAEVASKLLARGIPFYEAAGDQHPAKIYSLYRGVIYEAVPTMPGISWHGYPWRGDLPGRNLLPRRIRKELKQMAINDGSLQEYEQWLKQYG